MASQSRYSIEVDKAVSYWLADEWELCQPICEDLLEDPGLPRFHRAWSHLMIATDPRESNLESLSHATLAESLFRLMVEAHPDNECHKAGYKMAKETLDSETLEALEIMHEVEPDNVDIENRYKAAKEAYLVEYPYCQDYDLDVLSKISNQRAELKMLISNSSLVDLGTRSKSGATFRPKNMSEDGIPCGHALTEVLLAYLRQKLLGNQPVARRISRYRC